ncbi:hypothetical protein HDU98_009401 [Podochytrium sp. JEL0797]|nr:hypothetical protein HDU98_009401 [Podochytrium sp. JEL0797]
MTKIGAFLKRLHKDVWMIKGIMLILTVGVATVIVWVAAVETFKDELPSFTGLLVVAYTLGLRHAMDADHIAAIDNVTRSLVKIGQKPVSVGLFFSLGHSTIVIIATFLIAIISSSIQSGFADYNNIAGYVGTIISAVFLVLISVVNGISAWGLHKQLKELKNNPTVTPMGWEELLNNGGFFTRLFGLKLFKLINKPWKMYFVGFLFGLGFDTATEISVLALAVCTHSKTNNWLIMFFPALFTVGMNLIDSLDGILISGIYGWADIHPVKKLWYNFYITMVSMIYAIFIALVECLGLITINDPFFNFMQRVNGESFQFIGIGFAVTLVVTWIISALVYRYGGYADLQSKVVVQEMTDDLDEMCDEEAGKRDEETPSIMAVEGGKKEDDTPSLVLVCDSAEVGGEEPVPAYRGAGVDRISLQG